MLVNEYSIPAQLYHMESYIGGKTEMKLVQAWIEIHNEELMADWSLAISGETIFKIDPLK